jgi:hypothetical protein
MITVANLAQVRRLLHHAAALVLYQRVLQTEAGQALIELLTAILVAADRPQSPNLDCLRAYGHWFHTMASHNQSWQDYLLTRILHDDNPFTRYAQQHPLQTIPAALVEAAQQDLRHLTQLYQLDAIALRDWVAAVTTALETPVAWRQDERAVPTVRSRLQAATSWEEIVAVLAAHYRQHGVGLLAEYKAFQWQDNTLVGIANPDPIALAELTGYDDQKQALLKNTEALLRGYPALHVLLYGSRGSGKSSLVKALLGEFGDRGLRLVEVPKSVLQALPVIVDRLRHQPQKFIVFVDDLSFEEDNDSFKALKVVLEGSLTARAENIVVYATSNRRHLVREFFDDRPRPRDADEIQPWDTVQEKLSFSDRFGLTLTFEPANQDTYLQIVHHLAQHANLPLTAEEIECRALQWATRHNGRSGRTARQFITNLQAELALQSHP